MTRPPPRHDGDRRLDTEIRRAVTELVDLAPAAPPLDEGLQPQAGRGRGRGARPVVVVLVCTVIVVATLVGAVTLRQDGDPAGPAGPAAEPPGPAVLKTRPDPSIPPVRPVPQELADPTPTPNGFPQSLEDSNEAMFPGSLLHRSGGPYLSEAQIRERALVLARCGPEPSSTTARCDGMAVRFFDGYGPAFEAYGPPAWSYYVGFFGHDREVYLVTVYGALPYCNRGLLRISGCPFYRDHQNLVIDATTGGLLPG